MSMTRKIAHKSAAARAGLTATVGRVTGSRRLRAKGRRGKAKASLRQAGAKIKKAVRR
jgi:uncharacterized protein YjbJ (UPF0337 family)